ncbi:MAG: FHA domain-containing protein [Oscillospiraceae bacterium]|nr:FHA domain-containing protein [Oscillospiraceae bacterium]
MLRSLEIPDLALCAMAVLVLDLFALAVILAARRESALCRKRWQKVSDDLELRVQDKHFPLGADEILLGRHISADIRLPDPSVSRYHAVLTVSGGIWRITDLDSRSGTYVNDKRVHSTRLIPGDSIRLGNTRLRLVRQGQPRRKEAPHV